MLVLTRQVDEEIVIDGGITIKVVEIRGGKVRIGVVAPPETKVFRAEVLERTGGVDTTQATKL